MCILLRAARLAYTDVRKKLARTKLHCPGQGYKWVAVNGFLCDSHLDHGVSDHELPFLHLLLFSWQEILPFWQNEPGRAPSTPADS